MDSESCKRFSVGMLPTNCYLIDQRYLLDPGGMSDELRSTLQSEQVNLEAILLTHGHWDHIGGIPEVRELLGSVPVYCHETEKELLGDASMNFSNVSGEPLEFEADSSLSEVSLPVGDSQLEVLETPGHTTGSVSFHWPQRESLFSGDLLFKGGVGRTDLPGSDRSSLESSLRKILSSLPDRTRVLPGHGPETTLEEERKRNPFLKSMA